MVKGELGVIDRKELEVVVRMDGPMRREWGQVTGDGGKESWFTKNKRVRGCVGEPRDEKRGQKNKKSE